MSSHKKYVSLSITLISKAFCQRVNAISPEGQRYSKSCGLSMSCHETCNQRLKAYCPVMTQLTVVHKQISGYADHVLLPSSNSVMIQVLLQFRAALQVAAHRGASVITRKCATTILTFPDVNAGVRGADGDLHTLCLCMLPLEQAQGANCRTQIAIQNAGKHFHHCVCRFVLSQPHIKLLMLY